MEQLVGTILSDRGRAAQIARALLDEHGTLRGVLTSRITGREGDDVRRLLGLVERAFACFVRPPAPGEIIRSSADVVQYLRAVMADCDHEELRLLLLNARNELISDRVLLRGCVNAVPIYVGEILRSALLSNASAFILVHNHPSGDPAPSSSDIEATRRLKAAATQIGIKMLDHLVIASTGWSSLETPEHSVTQLWDKP